MFLVIIFCAHKLDFAHDHVLKVKFVALKQCCLLFDLKLISFDGDFTGAWILNHKSFLKRLRIGSVWCMSGVAHGHH